MPLECLRPLTRVPDVTLYSLQCGDGRGELLTPDPPFAAIDLAPDFPNTAAAIEALDLVVTSTPRLRISPAHWGKKLSSCCRTMRVPAGYRSRRHSVVSGDAIVPADEARGVVRCGESGGARAVMKSFAVIVPIGPGATELRRFHDFLDSLWSYEQGARLCVAIDDSPYPRNVIPRQAHLPVRDPERSFSPQGRASDGAAFGKSAPGVRVYSASRSIRFRSARDTDALVAGKFREAVSGFLSEHPKTGMLGTLGFTCRRSHPHYGCEKESVSDVVVALDKMSREDPAFLRIARYLHAARTNGYAGKEYCQGGVYALPCRTLQRMSSLGCFEHPGDWLPLAVPEDVMMGMLVRAAGLQSSDFSRRGEPFGNNWGGLAYSLAKCFGAGTR